MKGILYEANKCLYVIRSLRKEWYSKVEVDHLFKSIVLPKITYGLPIYGTSGSELSTVQRFLQRRYKRNYISELLEIYELLEKADRKLFDKIRSNAAHPLYALLPRAKESSIRLRNRSCLVPKINTECFKTSFINRLVFRYNLVI